VDSATFAGQNVGNGQTVTIALSLGGNQAANYTLDSSVTRTANIIPKTLTIDPASVIAQNKPYDQSNSATVTYPTGEPTLVGVISGDTVSVKNQTRTYTFSNATVATNKTVNTSGYALDGADANNYSLTAPTFLRANITRLTVTPTLTVSNKVYNGSNNVVSSTLGVTGVLSDDTVTISSGTRTFSDKNVADGKTVTAPSLTLSGTHAGNYTLDGITSVTALADITPFRLTVTPSADNKIYDGNITAVASCTVNKFGTDDVAADCSTATFDNKNVLFTNRDSNGTPIPIARPVTITGVTLTGNDAGNYLLPLDSDSTSEKTTFDTTAIITMRALKASGFTANNKNYDGTNAATFSTATLVLGPVVNGGEGLVAGDENDVVFSTPAGIFDSRNAGTHNVRLQSWTLTGSASNNYTIDVAASLVQATIAPIDLDVIMTANDKVYDGTTAAVVSSQIDTNGLVPGDTTANISVSTPSGTFADKNVGNAKTVTVDPSSVSFSGSLRQNYEPRFVNPSASITQRSLVWTVTAVSRPYDGTTDVSYTLADNRVSGDTFTVDPGTGSFSSASRGTAKTVTVTGISISGGDAGNYAVPTTAQVSANITVRQISVTGAFTAADKTYDRTRVAVVTDTSGLTLGNVVAADQAGISISGTTAVFDNRNVGTNKAVTLSSLNITGANASNYSISVSGVTPAAASITPRALTPVIVVADRLWNGTTAATISSITATPIAGDSVTLQAVSATFDSPDQGTNKTVTITGITVDSSNYSVPSTATTTASITGTPVTVVVQANNKTYDGTDAVTVSLTENDSTPGDDLTISFSSARFAQADAGSAITVTVSGISLSGADAAKYVLVSPTATTTADITAIALSVVAADKVYDGTDLATVSLDGVLPGDTVRFASPPTATFDDPAGPALARDVGSQKAVTISGLSLAGSDSANYTINSTETSSASITKRTLIPTFTPITTVDEPSSPVTVTVADDRVSGDSLTVNYTGAEAIRRGNQLVLVVSGITLTGNDAGNYIVASPFELVLRTFSPPPSRALQPGSTSASGDEPRTPPTRRFVAPTPGDGGPNPAPAAPGRALNPPAPAEAPSAVAPGLPGVRLLAPGEGAAPPASAARPTIDVGAQEVISDPNAVGTSSIAVRSVSDLVQEQLAGFAPGARTAVEILGARTGARFVVSELAQIDSVVLQRAIEASISAQATDFFAIERVQTVNEPVLSRSWNAEDRAEIAQVFDASGLPAPTNVSDIVVSSESPWILVEARSSTYAPGTEVYLTLTSEPIVIGSAIVDQDGKAVVLGTLPVELLSLGEHRIRLVGIRALEGAFVDGTGMVGITEELLAEIQRFDQGTQSTIAIFGENPEGASHTALRVVPLVAQAPWWTLWLIAGAAGVGLVARMIKDRRPRVRRWGSVALVLGATIPAVVLGWLSTVVAVTWWGLAIGLVAAALAALGPYRGPERNHQQPGAKRRSSRG
jgi:hypothetical protein